MGGHSACYKLPFLFYLVKKDEMVKHAHMHTYRLYIAQCGLVENHIALEVLCEKRKKTEGTRNIFRNKKYKIWILIRF